MKSIVVATGNAGKLKEIQHIVAPFGFEVVTQKSLNVTEAEETGLTFVENALIKARNAAQQTGKPALADDSGLEVDALKGQPGIYSARYAGENATDADNNAKLLEALKDIPEAQRTARFQCVMVYLKHPNDPTPLICQGTWEGRILFEPKGDNGFGYDPLFLVPEKNCASAELTSDIKNAISHRGKALQQLLEKFQASQNPS